MATNTKDTTLSDFERKFWADCFGNKELPPTAPKINLKVKIDVPKNNWWNKLLPKGESKTG